MMWWAAVFDEVWTAAITPSSATGWERAVDAVDASLVARGPAGLIPAARSDQAAPLEWLPYLAAERSVNEFSGSWPQARQREVTAGSFPLHQRLGVRAALDRAIAPFGYNVRVVEWFEVEPRRTPYTFRLRITLPANEPWSALQRPPLIRIANGAKNAHTKLEAIALKRSAPPATMFVGGVIRRRRTIRVGQVPTPMTLNQTTHVFMGAVRRTARKIIIRPRD